MIPSPTYPTRLVRLDRYLERLEPKTGESVPAAAAPAATTAANRGAGAAAPASNAKFKPTDDFAPVCTASEGQKFVVNPADVSVPYSARERELGKLLVTAVLIIRFGQPDILCSHSSPYRVLHRGLGQAQQGDHNEVKSLLRQGAPVEYTTEDGPKLNAYTAACQAFNRSVSKWPPAPAARLVLLTLTCVFFSMCRGGPRTADIKAIVDTLTNEANRAAVRAVQTGATARLLALLACNADLSQASAGQPLGLLGK